jgi:hypothetical protein
MKKLTLAVLLALLLMTMVVVPAFAIVHPVTPIGCTGSDVPAAANSGGNAGGAAAFPAVSSNDSPGPPFPAQGTNSANCE